MGPMQKFRRIPPKRREDRKLRRWVLIGLGVFVAVLLINEFFNPGSQEGDDAYRLGACPHVQKALKEALPPNAQATIQPCDSYNFAPDTLRQNFVVSGHVEVVNTFGQVNRRSFVISLFRDARQTGWRSQAWSVRSAVVN